MNDVLLVEKLESLAGLPNYLDGLLLCKGDAVERVVQVLPLQVLLHDEKVLSVLENVVHADDVGVTCVHKHLELVDE